MPAYDPGPHGISVLEVKWLWSPSLRLRGQQARCCGFGSPNRDQGIRQGRMPYKPIYMRRDGRRTTACFGQEPRQIYVAGPFSFGYTDHPPPRSPIALDEALVPHTPFCLWLSTCYEPQGFWKVMSLDITCAARGRDSTNRTMTWAYFSLGSQSLCARGGGTAADHRLPAG